MVDPIFPQAIKHFWTLEESKVTYNRDDIIPDSYIELIVNVGAPLTWESDSGASIDLPRAFLVGLQKKPLRLRADGLVSLWRYGSMRGRHVRSSA